MKQVWMGDSSMLYLSTMFLLAAHPMHGNVIDPLQQMAKNVNRPAFGTSAFPMLLPQTHG
jgi:hypothetical protein